jgi:hypothetical protein
MALMTRRVLPRYLQMACERGRLILPGDKRNKVHIEVLNEAKLLRQDRHN